MSVRIILLGCVATALLGGASTVLAHDWERYPGTANDIAVGADGSVWMIGTNDLPGGYGIWRWNERDDWLPMDGVGVRIAVDPAGLPWVVNERSEIFRWSVQEEVVEGRLESVGRWQRVRGFARDIGIGSDGSVWMIDTEPAGPRGFGIRRWDGSGDWTPVEGAGMRIAVDPQGSPWVVAADDTIWRRTANGWLQVPGTAWDVSVGADGSVVVAGTNMPGGGYGVWAWDGASGWTTEPGAAQSVAVGPTGDVWLATEHGRIFHGAPAPGRAAGPAGGGGHERPPYGGTGGAPFRDEPGPAGTRALEVLVRASDRIDALQVVRQTPAGEREVLPLHGREAGELHSFLLEADEWITGISGRYGERLEALVIHTNKRSSPRYGGDGGHATFDDEVPAGMDFAGFFGRAGESIEALGLSATPSPLRPEETDPIPPPKHWLQFDGEDDYVQLQRPLDLASPRGHTIELRVRVPKVGEAGLREMEPVGILLGNWVEGSADACNWEIDERGRLQVLWNGGEVRVYGQVDLRDGLWHHVAFVRYPKKGVYRVYLDGQLESSVSGGAGADLVFRTPHRIGADNRRGPGRHFHGEIAEIAIWKFVRRPQEFRESTQSGAFSGDTPSHWRFREAAGASQLPDAGPAGNHGTLVHMDLRRAWISPSLPAATSR